MPPRCTSEQLVCESSDAYYLIIRYLIIRSRMLYPALTVFASLTDAWRPPGGRLRPSVVDQEG